MSRGLLLSAVLVVFTLSCGLGPSPCGEAFGNCELDDPQAMQKALDRPEAKLSYPASQLLDQAGKGLKGEYTPTGTEARVTRLFQLPAGTTLKPVVEYYDKQLTALGWQRAPEPADMVMHKSVTPDNFVRWVLVRGQGGDLFILTSAELPAGEYRAQLTVDGIDSQGRDDFSAYLQTKLDTPDPQGVEPSVKPSASS